MYAFPKVNKCMVLNQKNFELYFKLSFHIDRFILYLEGRLVSYN